MIWCPENSSSNGDHEDMYTLFSNIFIVFVLCKNVYLLTVDGNLKLVSKEIINILREFRRITNYCYLNNSVHKISRDCIQRQNNCSTPIRSTKIGSSTTSMLHMTFLVKQRVIQDAVMWPFITKYNHVTFHTLSKCSHVTFHIAEDAMKNNWHWTINTNFVPDF